LKLKEIKYLKL